MVELLKARGEGANEKDTVGWYHFQIGDAKTAEFYIREALLLDPNNATIRGHLALLLAETKRDKEAVLEAGKILQQLPPGKLKDRVGSLLTKGAK
jgi:Flp pilus assembly protein TadD